MIDRASVADAIKRRYGVHLNPIWLSNCLTHIANDLPPTSPTNLHIEVQIRLVTEQLLNSEISESCQPTLHPDPQTNRLRELRTTPPGAFLQVQEVMDVGISKFAMWEAVRAKEDYEVRGMRPSYLPQLDDDEESESNNVFSMGAGTQASAAVDAEPKIPRGVLKLTLSDGRTEFTAIETATVQQLSVELPIGTKILVSGGRFLAPVGVFQLEPGCVKVLGGAPPQYAQLTLKERLGKILHPEGLR